jgi:hypothetical protein
MILELALQVVLAAPAVCDPSLATVFAPAGPALGRYEVCTSNATIESLSADSGHDSGDTASYHWSAVELEEPLDAFSPAGRYDRSKLARLYGGRRVRVMRGWRNSGTGFESVTLLSPYPDQGFVSLDAGTLIVRWILPRTPPNAPRNALPPR